MEKSKKHGEMIELYRMGERPPMYIWSDGSLFCKIGDNPYFSNYTLLTDKIAREQDAKYFLFNHLDLEKLGKPNKKMNESQSVPREALDSLKEYSRFINKEYIIRTFPEGTTYRILTDDILELIPIIMKQHGKNVKQYGKKVGDYRKKWEVKDPVNTSNSVDIDTFKQVMNGLKVDKSLITILLDFIYHTKSSQMLETSIGPITFLNRDGKEVMTMDHAVFYIFQSIICDRKWEDHIREDDRFGKLQVEFFKVAMKYLKMHESPQRLIVTKEYVDKDIEYLNKHKIFTEGVAGPKIPNCFAKMRFNVTVTWEEYEEECKKYDLSVLQLKPESGLLPAFAARFNILLAYIELFYPPYAIEFKMHVLEGLLGVMPESIRAESRECKRTSYINIEKQYEEYMAEKERDEMQPTTSDAAKRKKDSQEFMKVIQKAAKEQWNNPGKTTKIDYEKYGYLFDEDEETGGGKLTMKKLERMANMETTEVISIGSDIEEEFEKVEIY